MMVASYVFPYRRRTCWFLQVESRRETWCADIGPLRATQRDANGTNEDNDWADEADIDRDDD